MSEVLGHEVQNLLSDGLGIVLLSPEQLYESDKVSLSGGVAAGGKALHEASQHVVQRARVILINQKMG